MPGFRPSAPRAQGALARSRAGSPTVVQEKDGTGLDARRVLVLDDDPGVGRTVKLIVEAAGMECVNVTRVGDFFTSIQEWQPTHVLLDLMMPGMDGVEVMSRLAERQCTAYVILISGVGAQVLDAARRAAGANGLNVMGTVEKPFSAAKLVSALRRCGTDAMITGHGNGLSGVVPFAITDADIERAVQQSEFRLAYQPKVRCDNAALVGFEALIRWQHPIHGGVPPDSFIPLAETSGKVISITRLVLEQAVEWLSRYEHPTATLSVNVSARCLRDTDFTDHLIGLCGHFGVDPARLVLELTETAATEDPIAALNILTRLRLRGVALSIDDFGTGYSSMAQLAQLPFSEIKIDKSFIMAADSSERAQSIIRSTVNLGRQLGMQITAEGVETVPALRFLKRIGCDYAQGFLFSRPLESDAARVWCGVEDPEILRVLTESAGAEPADDASGG